MFSSRCAALAALLISLPTAASYDGSIKPSTSLAGLLFAFQPCTLYGCMVGSPISTDIDSDVTNIKGVKSAKVTKKRDEVNVRVIYINNVSFIYFLSDSG